MKHLFTITTTLILFLSFSFLANAGSSNRVYRGYVVTNSGEKLIGKIQMLSPTLNEVKVKFIGKGSTKRVLKAKDVKEYSFRVKKWNKKDKQHEEVWITYVRKKVDRSPIPFGPTNVLIERQIEGSICLYNHFIEQSSNTSSPYTQVRYIERNKDELILISQDNYKKILRSLTVDNPFIHNKIGKRGYYFNNIDKIITEYNTWLEENGTI